MEEERIKEYIFQATQAGKQETSGLVSEVLKKMSGHIKEQVRLGIKEEINGKILTLTNEFREHKLNIVDYIKEDRQDKEKIFNWQNRAEPVIKMGENVAGFGKVSLYVLGFIASVTGAVIGLIKLFEKK